MVEGQKNTHQILRWILTARNFLDAYGEIDALRYATKEAYRRAAFQAKPHEVPRDVHITQELIVKYLNSQGHSLAQALSPLGRHLFETDFEAAYRYLHLDFLAGRFPIIEEYLEKTEARLKETKNFNARHILHQDVQRSPFIILDECSIYVRGTLWYFLHLEKLKRAVQSKRNLIEENLFERHTLEQQRCFENLNRLFRETSNIFSEISKSKELPKKVREELSIKFTESHKCLFESLVNFIDGSVFLEDVRPVRSERASAQKSETSDTDDQAPLQHRDRSNDAFFIPLKLYAFLLHESNHELYISLSDRFLPALLKMRLSICTQYVNNLEDLIARVEIYDTKVKMYRGLNSIWAAKLDKLESSICTDGEKKSVLKNILTRNQEATLNILSGLHATEGPLKQNLEIFQRALSQLCELAEFFSCHPELIAFFKNLKTTDKEPKVKNLVDALKETRRSSNSADRKPLSSYRRIIKSLIDRFIHGYDGSQENLESSYLRPGKNDSLLGELAEGILKNRRRLRLERELRREMSASPSLEARPSPPIGPNTTPITESRHIESSTPTPAIGTPSILPPQHPQHTPSGRQIRTPSGQLIPAAP